MRLRQVLRKIAISDLQVDMYVAELITSDPNAMPKKKKGMIRDQRIISKFIEIGITKVVIDSEKGLDLGSTPSDDEKEQLTIKHKQFVNSIVEQKLAELQRNTGTGYQALSLEWSSANEIFRTTASIIAETKTAIQDGQAINIGYFDEASKAICRSIMRNKDALTWLGKIRNKRNYLYEHSVNTSTLMGIFAHAYGLNTIQVEQCITGALLHDLGQAKIPDELFERPGPLSPDEYELVKGHVNYGSDIVGADESVKEISLRIIKEHHERVNGSGYPDGLKGNEISLYGRMFAIVDTYDAVTNNRCYKEAIPSSFGMRTLLELSKTHFDEGLVHQFIKCMGVYPTGSLARLDNGILAVVIAQNPVSPLKPLVKMIFNTKTNAFIQPTMLDLVRQLDGVKILKYEDPNDYNIDIDDFMPDHLD